MGCYFHWCFRVHHRLLQRNRRPYLNPVMSFILDINLNYNEVGILEYKDLENLEMISIYLEIFKFLFFTENCRMLN